MKLTAEQRREVFERTGSHVDSACEGCGQILGAVRYAIRGDGREWCSAKCREPHLPQAWREYRQRRADRTAGTLLPRKHRTIAERVSARRETKRAYAERRRQRFAVAQV